MKIGDRKRWERELTHHMRQHAADLHKPPKALHKPAKARAKPAGIYVTGTRMLLWTILVMIMTSAGWAIGLYLF
ncbi:MAG: hypothetical protein ACRDSH_00795 [Pseudonocardiaceae bacterium]